MLKKEPLIVSNEAIRLQTYFWDQESKIVKINVELEGIGDVPKEDIEVTFKSHSFEMICNCKGKQYRFSLSNLAHPIVESESSFRVRPGGKRIIFSLKKKESKHWDSIFKKEEPLRKPKMDSSDPSQGIMDLMKNMYDEGDDDMKRTIAKAWIESREKNEKKGGMPSMDL